MALCVEARVRPGFHELMTIELIRCPDPECAMPAEVVDRFVLPSTAGPVEHLRTYCVLRHVLTPRTDHQLTGLDRRP